MGQPSVSGKLVAGLLLSPTVIDLLGRLEHDPVARAADQAQISTVATLGVILLLFVAGLETDLDEFVRAGRAAVLVAWGGVLATIGMVCGAGIGLGLGWREALFVGVMLAATSVSISVQTLLELRRLQTPLGMTVLGAAVTDDVIGLIAFSLTLAALGVSGTSPVLLLLGLAAFFVLSIGLGLRLAAPAVELARRLRSSEALLGTSIAFCLAMGWLAQRSGIAAITGAYLAGLILGRAAGAELSGRMRVVAYALPVPVFLVSVGMQTDLGHLSGGTLLVVIPVLAVLGKIAGCGGGALLARFRGRDAVAVGVGMIPRGEVTLVIAVLGVQQGVLSQTGYALGVLCVLVTALVTPPALKALIGALPVLSPVRGESSMGAAAEISA